MIGVILYSLILSVVLVWYYKYKLSKELRLYLLGGLGIKIVGAISLGLFYLIMQDGGDTWKYHHAALIWRAFFLQDPIGYFEGLFLSGESLSRHFIDQPRAIFFTKILSVFEILTFGNYWTSAVLFGIVSFCSSWCFFRRLTIQFGSATLWFIALFLFPSLVFWCSGILKETISFSIIAFLSAIAVKYYFGTSRINYFELILSLISVWMLIKLKYYVAGVFVPLMIGVLLVRYLSQTISYFKVTKTSRYVMMAGVILLFLMIATTINHNLSLENILDRIVMTHDTLYQESDEAFRINYENLEPAFFSFVRNAPLALISGLFRPFFWETNSLMSLIAGIENLCLTAIVFVAVVAGFRKRLLPGTLGLGLIIYILIMAMFLALATPNFGTLMRFKTSFTPYIVLICFWIIKDWKSISARLQR